MESNSAEDEDLIDLETGVHLTNASASGTVTIEHQERLFVVCLPKLEQKFSLTCNEQFVTDHCDNDNGALVELGHDQVIPAQKRIDVILSENIKRRCCIIKNLEPLVMSLSKPENQSDDVVHLSLNSTCYELDERTIEDKPWGFLNFHSELSMCSHKMQNAVEEYNEETIEAADQAKYSCNSLRQQFITDIDNIRKCSNIINPTHVEFSSSWQSTSTRANNIAVSEITSEGSEVDWSWIQEVEKGEEETTDYSSCSSHVSNLISNTRLPSLDNDNEMESIFSSGNVNDIRLEVQEEEERILNEHQRSISSCINITTIPPVHEILRQIDIIQLQATSITTILPSGQDQGESLMDHERENTIFAHNTSWIRASMRQLRHLRLPEAERNGRTDSTVMIASAMRQVSSGPNSLPNIPLVAPEVLATHTNSARFDVGTRSSSAPVARNSGLTDINPSTSERSHNVTTSLINSLDTCRSDSSTSRSDSTETTSSQRYYSVSPRHVMTNCIGQRELVRENQMQNLDNYIDENNSVFNGRWPHAFSPALACLGCTLGLFNISRFAILSLHFGANFIVQFLLLSLVLGIPLFTLQTCLGQRLTTGTVGMWKISPAFHGVGIALLVAQALIGVYSIVGVSWMLIYFKDSFIYKEDIYKWAKPYMYKGDTAFTNNSLPLTLQTTVPDYFNGVILQRYHHHYLHRSSHHEFNEINSANSVSINFQVAFSLAMVWIIIFLSLSKGLKSYGRAVYIFTLTPIFGTLVFCTKLLGLTPAGTIEQIFPATFWNEFFINNRSWLAAASEAFLTWGLFGAVAMQIAAHNKQKNLLQRDTNLVIVLTIVVLLLFAFLANICAQILKYQGYIYTPSSFETMSKYNSFLRPIIKSSPSSGHINTPERFMSHVSFIVGQRTIKPSVEPSLESGYQVLQLPTELMPATLAVLGTDQVSPVWTILFYLILIMFGISQQLAIWHCVLAGIITINFKFMTNWQTTIIFFSCTCAYLLGLPIATEFGIYIIYYLDYIIGGTWWIMILYFVQIIVVFAVRGRPHTGEAVVEELFPPTGRFLRHWAAPLLSFTWNLILPVSLIVLSIALFKSGNYKDVYTYKKMCRYYWPVWARQIATLIQIIPILLIPMVAFIQTYRYLRRSPIDIFDQIQLLYRPPLRNHFQNSAFSQQSFSRQCHRNNDGNQNTTTTTATNNNNNNQITTIDISTTTVVIGNAPNLSLEDPPPKYTPPPSYTTATGARIAKMLRQSLRRSVRRIVNVLGESSNNSSSGTLNISRTTLQPPPPDYSTISVDMNLETTLSVPREDILINSIEIIRTPDATNVHHIANNSYSITVDVNDGTHNDDGDNSGRQRSSNRTDDVNTAMNSLKNSPISRTHSTIQRMRKLQSGSRSGSVTAVDVANLLRSSIRRGTTTNYSLPSMDSNCNLNIMVTSTNSLANAATPIGQRHSSLQRDLIDANGKTVDEIDSTSSVTINSTL